MKDNLRIFSPEELEIRNIGLVDVTNILESLEIEYFLTDGTLLGAVREGDFIPWDWDVEITVLSESIYPKTAELIEKAKNNGFYVSSIDQSFSNFKLNLNKLDNKYSLNGLCLNGNFRTRQAYSYPKEFFLQNSEIEFRGKKYPTVTNINEYLIYQYGDWKTPSKSPLDKKTYLTKSVRRDSGIASRVKIKVTGLLLLIRATFSKILKNYGYFQREREINFTDMYLHALEEGTNIIEIGSSDCSEIISVRKHVNCPKNLKINIIEPSQENILNCKKAIRRSLKQYDDINFVKGAVDESDGHKEFYLSTARPNLNSFSKLPIHDRSEGVKTFTLKTFYEDHNLNSPLFIKMDIEGHEVKILDASIEFLKFMNNVYILLEIHPIAYTPDNSFYQTLINLFQIGFDVSLVESAGVPIPKTFKENNYTPFKVQNNRGLYNKVSKEFLLQNATKNIQDYLEDSSLSLKQVRSILLHKEI